MRRLYLLFILELKKSFLKLPRLFFSFLFLLFLTASMVFAAARLSEPDTEEETVTIAFVSPESSESFQVLLSLIHELERMPDSISFLQTSREDAEQLLADRKVSAVFIIPEQFVEGVLDSTNPSVRILFPADSGLDSLLIKELALSSAKMLGAAQSFIYTIHDMYFKYHMESELNAAYLDINAAALKYAFSIHTIFGSMTASAFGNLSAVFYYTASGLVLFLFLWMAACADLLAPEPDAFTQKLTVSGIGRFKYLLIRLSSLSLLLVTAAALFGCGFFIICRIFHIPIQMPLRYQIFAFLPLLFSICSISQFFFELTQEKISGVLILFFSSVLMLFFSGAFLPLSFFPKEIRQISRFLPTTPILSGARELFSGTIEAKTTLSLLFIIFIFYFLSVFCGYLKHGFHSKNASKRRRI